MAQSVASFVCLGQEEPIVERGDVTSTCFLLRHSCAQAQAEASGGRGSSRLQSAAWFCASGFGSKGCRELVFLREPRKAGPGRWLPVVAGQQNLLESRVSPRQGSEEEA